MRYASIEMMDCNVKHIIGGSHLRLILMGSGVVLPAVLFLFKYVLPAIFESTYSNSAEEQRQVFKEFILYPNDLLMISIGYTVPKTIEYLITISNNPTQPSMEVSGLFLNIVFTILVLAILPFMVGFTKKIEKLHSSKNIKDQNTKKANKKKAQKLCIPTYIVSLVLIIFSLILGV